MSRIISDGVSEKGTLEIRDFLSENFDNTSATSDPTVNDDESTGYSKFSRWINTASGEYWVCVDATAGSAQWVKASLTLDELGTAAVKDTGTLGGQVLTNDDLPQSEFTGSVSEHSNPTDVAKIARLDHLVDSGQINNGLTESVTLNSGVLTIPVGHSTIKLPSTVWGGSSNITISGFAFENGVQPEPGYEFALVIPRTGVASAGALGNEVLLQHGASLQVSANGFADLPCYPNAADNPDQDAVQYAAPYYRLKMRVEEYDGSGDPVVSVEELPDPVKITNDVGISVRWAGNYQTSDDKFDITNHAGGAVMTASGYSYSAAFSGAPNIIVEPSDFAEGTTADNRDLISVGANPASGTVDGNGAKLVALLYNGASSSFTSGDALTVNVRSRGEWY